MNDTDREERVKMMDARNWTFHLQTVTGAPRRLDAQMVQVRTTAGRAVKKPLWSAPN
jgi:hypothetical protein